MESKFEVCWEEMIDVVKALNSKTFGILGDVMTQGFIEQKELFKAMYEQGYEDGLQPSSNKPKKLKVTLQYTDKDYPYSMSNEEVIFVDSIEEAKEIKESWSSRRQYWSIVNVEKVY